MDQEFWDERYRTSELIWTATPNQFLVEETAGLTPGLALDLACGEGRNAVWLAEQGWAATGSDFSQVALDKGVALAAARDVDVTFEQHDATTWAPAPTFDLVAVFYLQLPMDGRRFALANAVAGVAPGGTLLVVAHDLENLTAGVGGPQSADVLYTVAETVSLVETLGLSIVRATQVRRTVATPDGGREAIDTLVRAVRPS